VSFYCLSQTLNAIPTGIAYAVWSGVGIVLISVLGIVLFKQRLDAPALIGIALILAGVLVINLFSKASAH
jgi:small multidrug resistance pump